MSSSSDIVVSRSFDQQKNSVQFPSPPLSSHSPPNSAALIDKYLTAYSNQASAIHSNSHQNTIQFPLNPLPPPAKRKADLLLSSSSSSSTSTPEPVRALQRWLLRTYQSDPHSVVPEIDIRVKFKTFCDRLARSGFPNHHHHRHDLIESIKQVFPDVTKEIQVLEGSIRANEEHVLRGIRFRRRDDSSFLSELDLRSSIPLELHSSELIEALRERVNELEDELEFETEVNKRVRLMSVSRDHETQAGGAVDGNNHVMDTQSDHSTLATSVHSLDSTSLTLAERIWNRLKVECGASNVRFEDGKKVTISWYDEVPESEFSAIIPFQQPHPKSHQTASSSARKHSSSTSIRIINLTSQQINQDLFSFNQGVGLVGNHWTYLKNKGKNIYLLKKNFKCVGLSSVRVEEGVVTYSDQTSQATFNFSVGLTNQ